MSDLSGHRWRQATELAAAQHGLVTSEQGLRLLGESLWRARKTDGSVVRVHRGVWRVSGSVVTKRQWIGSACFSVGDPVAASHWTSAALWDMEHIATGGRGIHLTVPRGRSGRLARPEDGPSLSIHHASLPAEASARRYGLPVTTVARTVADLAAEIPLAALERSVDELLRTRRLTCEELLAELTSRPTQRGRLALERVLEPRLENGVGDSLWEDQWFRLIVEDGLPRPQRQFEVVTPSGRLYHLDLAVPEFKVDGECDGFDVHGTRTAFDHDRERANELVLAGWIIVRFTSRTRRTTGLGQFRRALLSRGWYEGWRPGLIA